MLRRDTKGCSVRSYPVVPVDPCYVSHIIDVIREARTGTVGPNVEYTKSNVDTVAGELISVPRKDKAASLRL